LKYFNKESPDFKPDSDKLYVSSIKILLSFSIISPVFLGLFIFNKYFFKSEVFSQIS